MKAYTCNVPDIRDPGWPRLRTFLDTGESSSLKTKVFVVNHGTPAMSMLPLHSCLQMHMHVLVHIHTYTHECFHIQHKIPSGLCILHYQQCAHIYIILSF